MALFGQFTGLYETAVLSGCKHGGEGLEAKRNGEKNMFENLPKEVKAFHKQFEEAEKEVLLLVGANGVSGGKIGNEEYWVAAVHYIAMKENGVLQNKKGRLEQKFTYDDLHTLQGKVKANSIIKAKVRQGEGDRLLLVELLEYKEKDQELETLLQEQMKDIFYKHPYFGKLKLDKRVHWFAGKMDWHNNKVRFNVDQDEPEKMDKALVLAQQIFEQKEKWDREAKDFAAEKLLELKNDTWLDDGEETLTKEQFTGKLTLTDFSINPEGEFEFWFDDGDTFWGHAILVDGSVGKGFADASIQG